MTFIVPTFTSIQKKEQIKLKIDGYEVSPHFLSSSISVKSS